MPTLFRYGQLLERETRREKTLEQRTKDIKGKQGFKVAAAAAFNQGLPANPGGFSPQPSSPKSPTASLRKAIIGSAEALQKMQQNQEAAPNNADDNNKEAKRVSGIEPPADMLSTTDLRASQVSLSVSHAHPEPTLDQNLQTAEESFFETIDQVRLSGETFRKIS